MIQAIDRERSRLGYQLHDSVAQTLVGLRFQMLTLESRAGDNPALIEDLRALRRSIADVLEEVRLLSLSVHPRIVDDLGLVLALRHLTHSRASGLDVVLHCDPAIESKIRELPVEVCRSLYLVVRECIDNTERHAVASRVMISFNVVENTVWMQIADDGRGFDTNLLRDPAISTGLLLITQRLTISGGELTLESPPPGGTVINARIPLPKPIPSTTE
ncbi:MAG: histidine kinase [Gemmatimonas sp.]